MRHAAALRRELGVRTAFNLLGPLTNPAGARRQIVGVPRPELTELVAKALGMLGSERAWVVHGADGLDEISTTGYTKVSEAGRRRCARSTCIPPTPGCPRPACRDLAGGDAAENAAMRADPVRRQGPGRDIVLLNAGAALLVAGAAASLAEGIARPRGDRSRRGAGDAGQLSPRRTTERR
jgi:anthranilate phosphoribosyltransferase